MSVLFLKLLNMSISAGWLILAVVALRFLLKKAPKWLPCVLWAAVALRLVCPVTPESVLSLIPSAETVSPEILYAQTPSISSGVAAINSAVNPVLGASLSPAPAASANPLQIWTALAAAVWLAGMAGMLLYGLVSDLKLRKRVRASLHLRDELWLCDEIGAPFLLGILKPRVFLPSGLDEAQQEAVIAHERAHLRRRDNWWKPLGYLLLAVYWFNPLCWLAYFLLCRDIELACDEQVVRRLEKDGRIAYSEALLRCSTPHRQSAACPLAFGEVGVRARIKTILNYQKPAFWLILAAVAVCCAVALCFLTNPKGPEFSFAPEDVVFATVSDARTGADPTPRSLNGAQISELLSRLKLLGKTRRVSKNDAAARYTLCLGLKDGSSLCAVGYSEQGGSAEILCDGRRYRVVGDPGFCSYLLNVCAGGDTAAAQDTAAGNSSSAAAGDSSAAASGDSSAAAAGDSSAAAVTEADIVVAQTPGPFVDRPDFDPQARVQEDELVSPHGYALGMTFAETQKLCALQQNMIDYAVGRENPDTPGLYIFVGNMTYNFEPPAGVATGDYDRYVLTYIYYGETIFCPQRETLSVLRGIRLGDPIGEALKFLPGNHVPQQWAIDQLYGEYGQPDSASLEYLTDLGFYILKIYCKTDVTVLTFGSSGKLWIAETRVIE